MPTSPRPQSETHRPSTAAERDARGKAVRRQLPRSSHGDWAPAHDRFDLLDVFRQDARGRVRELVPIRHGRMAETDFTFYRGAASVMAGDLGAMPSSGLDVQLCGDAHLANFGGFGSPERSMVFDVDDFDETLPGPFEWDVKRLAASLEIAARSLGFDDAARRDSVAHTVRSYRTAIRRFATMSNLELWYSRLDVPGIIAMWGDRGGDGLVKRLRRNTAKAESKDHLRAKAKLTETIDGELHFARNPPLMVPAADLFVDARPDEVFDMITRALAGYRSTLTTDRQHLFDGYRFVDLARRVVGVGSVGTRCWVALLVGRDDDDPLFIQIKEAGTSALEPFLGASHYELHGQRVVEGQRLMQAASDMFLGWHRTEGSDGRSYDYYMRQLWDWKLSADIELMSPLHLEIYGQMCGWVLARAHARSGDAIAIGSYLGGGEAFDDALVRFSVAYADQNEKDHRTFTDAIANGSIEATTGI